jgi:cobalt-zinc-cadmium efflux system outer membrane protein
MKAIWRAAFAAVLLAGTSATAAPVSLADAVRLALDAAPSGRADAAAIAAAEAARRQAAVRPNPTLDIESENIVGTGPYDAFRQAETTVTYSQTLERGGKRSARIGLADSEVRLAGARGRIARLDLAAEVQRAYAAAVVAGAEAGIAAERLRTERDVRAEAVRRVRGYRDPVFVETRADARVAGAELALRDAEARAMAARAELAAFWGGEAATLTVDMDDRQALGPSALAGVDADFASAEIDRAERAVAVERSRGVQDYTLSGGIRYLRDTDDVAAVAGVSIPLGRFDRNRGNIDRALAERRATELRAEADRIGRARRLAALVAQAGAARERAFGIEAEVRPRAQKTLAQVRAGYARGGFRFADIEAAADAILAARADWLDAVARAAELQTEIDRLTGRFDAPLAQETTK